VAAILSKNVLFVIMQTTIMQEDTMDLVHMPTSTLTAAQVQIKLTKDNQHGRVLLQTLRFCMNLRTRCITTCEMLGIDEV